MKTLVFGGPHLLGLLGSGQSIMDAPAPTAAKTVDPLEQRAAEYMARKSIFDREVGNRLLTANASLRTSVVRNSEFKLFLEHAATYGCPYGEHENEALHEHNGRLICLGSRVSPVLPRIPAVGIKIHGETYPSYAQIVISQRMLSLQAPQFWYEVPVRDIESVDPVPLMETLDKLRTPASLEAYVRQVIERISAALPV